MGISLVNLSIAHQFLDPEGHLPNIPRSAAGTSRLLSWKEMFNREPLLVSDLHFGLRP